MGLDFDKRKGKTWLTEEKEVGEEGRDSMKDDCKEEEEEQSRKSLVAELAPISEDN